MISLKEQILACVLEDYGIEPDNPFSDTPEAAVLRRPDNRKWFALIMTVPLPTLRLPGDGSMDILNLKCDPVLGGSLRTQPGFLPAYHMNKERWLTILLDGTVSAEQIRVLLAMSYDLVAPKRKKTSKKAD